MLYYFAYGSNMSTKRLTQRVASARFVSLATLDNHCLRFHKKSHDGSAKCDAFETDNSDDEVIGTLFTMDEAEKPLLDYAEGLGAGYDIKKVTLTLPSGKSQQAFTYYATDIDETFLPYTWYLAHVVNGAKEHGLPEDYVKKIKQIKAIEDTNQQRHEKESAIHI